MSKCPNKYLEYSIAGAAGVYSDTPPYSQTIVDGQTGLLVDDDEASWSAAITRLVEDAPLRQSIAAAARREVLQRFETGVVAPAFARTLLGLVRSAKRGKSEIRISKSETNSNLK
jgi:glycosyltransferase involved in cell wall biosynthesis